MAVLMFVLLMICLLLIMFNLRKTAVISLLIIMAFIGVLFLHDATTTLMIQL